MSLGTIDRARSALRFAETRLQAVAHNTANMVTEGFKEQEVLGVESPHGVVSHVRERTKPGHDLVRDTVDSVANGVLYRANMAVIREEDERLRQTVDLLA
jgi:flagellar basal body rod protein FlgG